MPLVQEPLHLTQHTWGQDRCPSPSWLLEKTSDPFLAVKFDRTFDTDRAHPEGPADLRLCGAAVDVKLAGDHAKGPLVIDAMAEYRQVTVKVSEGVVLSNKTKVDYA